jgi:glutathione S-transferase
MYKLYNVKTWGSLAPHCLLEELDVPYQSIWMTPRQVRAPEFRDLHPLGYVPVLGLPDGRTIIESAAIMTFLTIAHPDKSMAPPAGSLDHATFLSLLNFMSTSLYPAISMAISPDDYADDATHKALVVERATGRSREVFEFLEEILAKEGPWLLGEQYTALDIYLFMLSLWARPSERKLHADCPRIAALAAGLRRRPKLKAVLEFHGVLEIGGYAG